MSYAYLCLVLLAFRQNAKMNFLRYVNKLWNKYWTWYWETHLGISDTDFESRVRKYVAEQEEYEAQRLVRILKRVKEIQDENF
jgi:hypothetical protein